MPRTRLFPLSLAVSLLLVLTEFSTAQDATEMYQGRKAAQGEVLVRFRQASPTSFATMAQSYDLSFSRPLGGVQRLYRLRSRSRRIAELVREFASKPDVLYAEPNYQVHTYELPNDPQFVSQWGLQNTGQSSSGFSAGTPGADISAVSAWDISTGGITHVVGIVDTGVDYTHPDLQANIWSAPSTFTITLNGASVTCAAGTHGFNAITGACDPMDDYMHGTHVAGIIGAAGNNNLGVVGVNWTTQIMGLKFLNSQGYGYASDAITAMEFAIQVKSFFATPNATADVRILSNSWGGADFSQAIQDEIDEAAANDILFVAAAGNNGSNNDSVPVYPASFNRPNMIVVAATDNTDNLAYFSDYGPNTVHLGAPGLNILSTLPAGTYGYLSGTSMATPYVSGAAALMLSICGLSTPNLIKNLLDNVDPIPALTGLTTTGGRLNVNHALLSCNGPAGVSPIALTFGPVVIGQAGTTKVVTLTNYQTSALNLSSILASGDFSQTNNCGNALAAKASCAITVTFTPSAPGNRSGQIQVFDDAANSPQSATLAGTGVLNIDLVASTSVSVTTTSPGAVITVNSTVLDQGTATAGATVAGIYLSITGHKDNGAVAVGSFNVPPLSGRTSFQAQTSVTIPSSLTLGSYSVLTCADDTNLVAETNEANNCGATPTPIQVLALPPAATPTLSLNSGTYTTPQSVAMADASPGVTIYYTTDGSTPTTNSIQYTVPITIATSMKLLAIAAGNGFSASLAAVGIYRITALAPTFSPNPGTYTTPQSITMADATPGAAIYYTTDGSTPTTASTPYTGPITIATTTTLQAIAAGNGYAAGSASFGIYRITALAPTLSPNPGTYTTPQTITLTDSSPGVTIYYTTDGSTPTPASTPYTRPISIATTTTIQAIAAGNGYAASSAAYGIYRIAAATPTFSPAPGSYPAPQSVTITDASPGATVYYTTDGSMPTTSSPRYTGPLTVSATTTLQAIAAGNGYPASAVSVGVYKIAGAAAPTFSPLPGTYATSQTVTISDSSLGVTIYYTTDGSTPTTSSPRYTGPLTVSATTTLQAIAAGNGYPASSVSVGIYKIATAAPTFSPNPGTYSTPQSVTIADTSPGVTIYYTTDGSTPTTSSTQYMGPLMLATTTTLQAIAAGNGNPASSATFGIYKIAAAAPTFSPNPGTYNTPQSVAIADTSPGVTIYYTTDGSRPTPASPRYAGPIMISTTTTIQAIASGNGYAASSDSLGIYRITALAPTFSPNPGIYHTPQSVTIADASPGVTIYYTTDGSTPTTASPQYSGPITISTTTTLQAIAAGSGYAASSAAFGIYRIN